LCCVVAYLKETNKIKSLSKKLLRNMLYFSFNSATTTTATTTQPTQRLLEKKTDRKKIKKKQQQLHINKSCILIKFAICERINNFNSDLNCNIQ